MCAFPLPEVPLVSLSHETSATAVHGQLACVVIATASVPPAMHGVNVTGATRAIATGDLVRVDGDRGTVERLA